MYIEFFEEGLRGELLSILKWLEGDNYKEVCIVRTPELYKAFMSLVRDGLLVEHFKKGDVHYASSTAKGILGNMSFMFIVNQQYVSRGMIFDAVIMDKDVNDKLEDELAFAARLGEQPVMVKL